MFSARKILNWFRAELAHVKSERARFEQLYNNMIQLNTNLITENQTIRREIIGITAKLQNALENVQRLNQIIDNLNGAGNEYQAAITLHAKEMRVLRGLHQEQLNALITYYRSTPKPNA